MNVNEMFVGLQGEGKYAGTPVLFIRLSGCTRSCSFCDTKYHNEGKEIGYEEIIKKIRDSNIKIIVWTGGEPLLQRKGIYDVMTLTKIYSHQLETNGDLLTNQDTEVFTYIACSPKDKKTAVKVKKLLNISCFRGQYDIKIVTDLELNKDLIPLATMLMPLTKEGEHRSIVDKKIRQKVWNYCVKNNIRYCPRLHVEAWGVKRGV